MANEIESVLTLCNGGLNPNHYSWSPFVNKLEARLRFVALKYDLEAGSLSEAPKGKIPYVKLQSENASSGPSLIGDSTFIIKHLIEAGLVDDLNKDLSPAERVHDLALRALLEDKVYFYQVWERWVDPTNFYITRDIGPLAVIPYPIRVVVGILAHRKLSAALLGQGTGRYSSSERHALNEEAWRAINDLVSESQLNAPRSTRAKDKTKPRIVWAFGDDQPTEFDATLHGFLASVLICPANPDALATVRQFPALMRYASEVHDAYFPDYEKWED